MTIEDLRAKVQAERDEVEASDWHDNPSQSSYLSALDWVLRLIDGTGA